MIKLEFSIDEVNQIMAALGNMPYVQVAALIDKIKSQGSANSKAGGSQ